MEENKKYLTEQIITYIGNKRVLLPFIKEPLDIVRKELKKEKIDIFDVFSGSGVVARFFKKYSNKLYVNDLEDYSFTINKCYLTNKSEISLEKLDYWYNYLTSRLNDEDLVSDGFISRMYSPKEDENIKLGERVFYTNRNANYIDTCRRLLEIVPQPYRTLFLGPLLYEASVKTNTCGVLKVFIKILKQMWDNLVEQVEMRLQEFYQT